MSNKILVTYASRTGSTAGVAEAIGQVLAQSGAEVDVYPMQAVTDLRPYRAVVAGSAIQSKQWLPEATAWVRAHRDELARRPFAAYLVCMTLALKNEQWRSAANVGEWLAPLRALVTPVSEGFFAGVLDLARIPSFADRLQFRISILSGVWAEGDHRDWAAIRAWAAALPAKLG